MEQTPHGLTAEVTPWRPWSNKSSHGRKTATHKPYERPSADCKLSLSITHPVKLFWPKSQSFDYLYRDAETLLRDYPVQATICLYQDEEDEDEDEEDNNDEDEEKGLN